MQLKQDFPVFKGKQPYVYLDSAATTHKPQQVIDTICNFYSNSYATIHRNVYHASQETTEAYYAVRGKARRWIAAAYDQEIVFTRGATAALNLLAISFNDLWSASSGVVIVSEAEHHANLLSWELACRRMGNVVKKVPVDDSGWICLERLEDVLKQGASLVSLSHVSNVSGAIQPLKAIADLAHQYGAYLVIDGAQGVAHIPVNVAESGVDFYVFSGHKMYGPTGVGVLYGRRELLEKLPPVEGGGDMIAIYDPESPQFSEPPLKFEAGTPPIASVLGLGAAFDYLETIPRIVFDHEQQLTHSLYRELAQIPDIQLLGPGASQPRGSLISLRLPDVHPLDLGYLLDRKGIAVRTGHQCSQPAMQRWNVGYVLRASLGIYNDAGDIAYFLEALQEAIDIIRS